VKIYRVASSIRGGEQRKSPCTEKKMTGCAALLDPVQVKEKPSEGPHIFLKKNLAGLDRQEASLEEEAGTGKASLAL